MIVEVVREDTAGSSARYLVRVAERGHVGTVRTIDAATDGAVDRALACAIRLATSLRCPIVSSVGDRPRPCVTGSARG